MKTFSRSYSKAKIGFIGLGQMGFPMAKNLLTKYKPEQLHIFDTVDTVTAKFVKENPTAKVCKSPAEVARNSDVIVSMVPNPTIVKHVYLGENGVCHGAQKNALLIDSSTIGPQAARDVSKALANYPVRWIDAPVSGGTPGAINATLTFMVGAQQKSIFDEAKPILEGMGKNIVYCGEIGHGQIAKICNNMMLGTTMIAAAETLNLGIRLGMDPKLLSSILNTSTGRCWSTDSYNPVPGVMENVPSSRDYEGGFAAVLTHKDMALAMDAARDTKSTVVLSSAAYQIYNQLITTPGFEKKDFSSVFKWLDNNSAKFGPKK
ncbi:NAD binding domain of 6-phosphogluconate dehydrogenase-domain-containing protein [Gorgonomyces haynaldii]|nr:NAD binding domain of 6-phosphogluconate dehydrogenase-domain-containing protein [Gorgonomyces haynaldii]